MTNVLKYPVRLEREGAHVFVRFPDFPHAFTYGRDEQDALECAPDCLREALAGCIRDNEEVPLPSEAEAGAHLVDAPPAIAAKALVYRAFKRTNLSGRKLADLLNLDEREVRRILDPARQTRLDRLEKVGKALGVQLEVSARAL